MWTHISELHTSLYGKLLDLLHQTAPFDVVQNNNLISQFAMSMFNTLLIYNYTIVTNNLNDIFSKSYQGQTTVYLLVSKKIFSV